MRLIPVMSTHSILGLLYTLRGLIDQGEDLSPVLAKYRLDPDRLDPTASIERALELRIYVEIAHCLQDPLAGLRTGGYFGFTGYGPFSMLLMTSPDAYEAFQTGIRYQQLTFLFSTIRLEPGDKESVLVLSPVALPPKAFRFRIDGELSGTYKLLRDMQQAVGMNMDPLGIEIPYPKPAEAAAYEAHFRCPVYFGQGSEVRCRIPNAGLHLRFPTADATAHAMYRQLCDQQLARLRAGSEERLSDQVLSHLELFSERFPAAAEVATAFDIPERSFRRQLSAEGTSFRTLLDDVRFRKAQQLLAGTQPVEAIALQLGYAESAAFIHAFQRWAGTTPAAFRATHRR